MLRTELIHLFTRSCRIQRPVASSRQVFGTICKNTFVTARPLWQTNNSSNNINNNKSSGLHSQQPKSNQHLNLQQTTENSEPTTTAKEKAKDLLNTIKNSSKREDVWTIPNILTFSRLIASPVIGYLVVNHQTSWALGLFVYSCVTDLLDGWIARRYKLQSVVGSVIDPMADKALMMTLAGCLAVSGDIPLYLAVLILGRDFLLGLSALYYRYISLPPPKTFSRFWDFSLPSAEVHPTTISKYNTFLQMVYLGAALTYPAILPSLDAATAESLALGLSGLEYTVATTTVLSGLSYVFSKSAVKILNKD